MCVFLKTKNCIFFNFVLHQDSDKFPENLKSPVSMGKFPTFKFIKNMVNY